jgi:DNA-binding PadR family transcriptional regulator
LSARERRSKDSGDAEGGELPLTSYATLGLLSPGEEFAAVEIEERAHSYLRFFYWTPALSHIRRELDRLERLGYVDCREIILGRVKRTLKYWLTPTGMAALKKWAEDAPPERVVKKNPAILRLWLGRRGAAPHAVLDALETHIDFERRERQSLIEHIDDTEALYREHIIASEQASARQQPQALDALWRHAWHLEVMRYCLRDYDYELKNLEQLLSDMRQLARDQDAFANKVSVNRRRG